MTMNAQLENASASTHDCPIAWCSSDMMSTFATMTPMSTSSKHFVFTMSKMGLRSSAIAIGGLSFRGVGARSMRCCVSRQRCCSTVRKADPLSEDLSSANLSHTTPTKRFIPSKLPTTMNSMKKTANPGVLSRTGWSSFTVGESTHAQRVSSHISIVATS